MRMFLCKSSRCYFKHVCSGFVISVRLFEEGGVQSASVVIKDTTKTSRLTLSAAVTSDLGEAVPDKQQGWIVLG